MGGGTLSRRPAPCPLGRRAGRSADTKCRLPMAAGGGVLAFGAPGRSRPIVVLLTSASARPPTRDLARARRHARIVHAQTQHVQQCAYTESRPTFISSARQSMTMARSIDADCWLRLRAP